MWGWVLVLALVTLWCWCWFYWLSSWFRAVRLALRLPGPPAVPLLGNALLVTDHDKLLDLGRTAYQRYGPMIRAWITVMPTIVLLEPEHLQVVLSSGRHTEKPFVYGLLHNFLGRGLITSGGRQWREHRRLLQPGLRLERFLPAFHAGAARLVASLRACAHQPAVNVTRPVNECVLGILHEAVLGISEVPADSPYRQGKVTAPYRVLHPWLLLEWVYRLTDVARGELQQQRRLFQFTQKVVREKREAKATAEAASLADFVAQVGLTEEAAVHELVTFMLAGQDSVGAALAFCLLELARNPAAQERAAREAEAAAPEAGLDELRGMPYLDRCVRETLRLYPSVPFVLRALGADATLGDGVTLPAGTCVMVAPFATHRLPHLYPDPERFDPDRFLPESCAKRHPCAFLPFSAGPRNCVGHRFAMLELKVALAAVLREFRLQTVPGHEEVRLAYRITTRARGGVWVRLTPRTAPCAPAEEGK